MQLQIEGSTITVPVPDYDELKTGTLRSIIRQSEKVLKVDWQIA